MTGLGRKRQFAWILGRSAYSIEEPIRIIVIDDRHEAMCGVSGAPHNPASVINAQSAMWREAEPFNSPLFHGLGKLRQLYNTYQIDADSE